jgi:hypothetical protein
MHTKRQDSILWIVGIGFSFMIALIWLMEAFHVPHYMFGENDEPNWSRALARSCVLLIVWGIVHIPTSRLLKRLRDLEEYLRICAWCQKVGHEGEWISMQQYLSSTFENRTTHGVCPECSKSMVKPTATLVKPAR